MSMCACVELCVLCMSRCVCDVCVSSEWCMFKGECDIPSVRKCNANLLNKGCVKYEIKTYNSMCTCAMIKTLKNFMIICSC